MNNVALSKILSGLTGEQKEAVLHQGGVMLSSCPGAGKTTTATRMFVYKAHAVSAQNRHSGVALFSYTNIAVNEFRRQVSLLGYESAYKYNYVGTIDSFLEQYIIAPFYNLFHGIRRKPYLVDHPKFKLTASEKIWVNHLNGKRRPINPWEIDIHIYDGKIRYFERGTNAEISEDDVGQKITDFIIKYSCYNHTQRKFLCLYILNKYSIIAESLSRRFPCILVDEAQDTDTCSLFILDIISRASTTSELSFIGDFAQSIFSFNYVQPGIIREYVQQHKLCELKLTQTFRMKEEITSFVNKLFNTKIISKQGTGSFVYFIPESRYNDNVRNKIVNDAAVDFCDAVDIDRNASNSNLPSQLDRLLRCIASLYIRHNIPEAYKLLRSILLDESSSDDAEKILAGKEDLLWKALFDNSFPNLDQIQINGLKNLKSALSKLSNAIFGQPHDFAWIKRPSIKDFNWEAAVASFSTFSPNRTIHSVKGATIPIVFVHGSERFWTILVNQLDTEESLDITLLKEEVRIAYVAITRAKYGVILVLPDKHLKKKRQFWEKFCTEYTL